MKFHLYEFQSAKKKLKCLCGWERTVRTTDLPAIYKMFAKHCAQASLASRK